MAKRMSLTAFERGYVECALWCGVWDEESDDFSGSASITDLTDDALGTLVHDAADFEAANRMHLDAANEMGYDDEQLGHDFWLTRNRHGAGFWDRGLGDLGAILTDKAHSYGEAGLYLGANGTIHHEG